jgi:hypothetical protein
MNDMDDKTNEGREAFACWWTMVEAEAAISEEPIKDSDVVLSYMGCGASTTVTAGNIRQMLGVTAII